MKKNIFRKGHFWKRPLKRYEDASRYCHWEHDGAKLVEILSQSENDNLVSALGKYINGKNFWLGLCHGSKRPENSDEWTWQFSGEGLDNYSNWAQGEPGLIGSGRYCVQGYGMNNDIKWYSNNIDAVGSKKFICQMERGLVCPTGMK